MCRETVNSSEPEEPVLDIHEISGNILLGFNKDRETLLLLEILDAAAFRRFLLALSGRLTSIAEVLAFRRERRATIESGQAPQRSVWLEVAFTHEGLGKLIRSSALAEFKDTSFVADRLGEPVNALVLVAADDASELAGEVERLAREAAAGGARVLSIQQGARLSPRNREHFGFHDGISQPGIRGRLSDCPGDFLTRRENPDDPGEGKPGQAVLWPGEFVFGYPGQDPFASNAEGGIQKPGECSLLAADRSPVAPEWARNGSYLVFRRLRQDVGAFRDFIRRQASALGLAPALLEAKLVGRFKSGAPLMRTAHEDPALGTDGCANNDFLYSSSSPANNQPASGQCRRSTPPAPDLLGERCPFSSHIRKAYPRDDASRFVVGAGGRSDTESHRILRRAIPFGPPFPEGASPDGEERGMLFMCYQTSIVEQFEHIQRQWANVVEVRRDGIPAELPFGAGVDGLIGQSPDPRQRQFVWKLPELGLENGQPAVRLLTAPPFVVPTGGGYFFVPSLSAVAQMARGEL